MIDIGAHHLTDLPSFGTALTWLMWHKHITPQKLSTLANISQSYITRMMRDMQSPSIVIAARLASALGVCPNHLIDAKFNRSKCRICRLEPRAYWWE